MALVVSILFSLLLFPLYSSPIPLILPLTLHPTPTPTPTPLSTLALTSLLRAHHLKNPKTAPHITQTPLSSHSYGGYSLTLDVGTPPQPLPLLLDTGSSLTWVPCTHTYLCRKCPSPKTFIPKMSLTSNLIGCLNPKCSYIHPSHTCAGCTSRSNCSELCPPYFLLYGSGSTSGILLSDTLRFSGRAFSDVVVGCSLVSVTQPSGGIAGFGRGPVSVPQQLNLTRFSYCLVSRKYDDDNSVTGSLVLNGEKDDSISGVKFTPFLKNPDVNDVFLDYYYVGLSRITVGGMKVKVPDDVFRIDGDGNGGVIIDSGTTFTYMEMKAFDPLLDAFVQQVTFKRDSKAEKETGLSLCFQLPEGGEEVKLPDLVFQFKGGAEMKMPMENYFAIVGEITAAVCLTIVTDAANAGPSGPSVILGSFQQQNYYVVFDLEREKLGFRKEKSCIGT